MSNKPKFIKPNKPVEPVKKQVSFEEAYGFSPKDVNVLICTPCFGGNIYVGYFHSMIQTTAYLNSVGVRYGIKTIANESLITRARNTCVSYFLSHPEYTHLLFIDADISWTPESVLKLIGDRKPLVSGVYPKKAIEWSRLPELVKEQDWHIDTQQKCLNYVVNFNDARVKIEKNCVRVKDAPTGFMLIERSVFTTLKEKFPELRYTNDLNLDMKDHHPDSFWLFFDCIKDPVDSRYLSEDYAFCRLLQLSGIETWIDISIPLTHTGTYNFEGNIMTLFDFEK